MKKQYPGIKKEYLGMKKQYPGKGLRVQCSDCKKSIEPTKAIKVSGETWYCGKDFKRRKLAEKINKVLSNSQSFRKVFFENTGVSMQTVMLPEIEQYLRTFGLCLKVAPIENFQEGYDSKEKE